MSTIDIYLDNSHARIYLNVIMSIIMVYAKRRLNLYKNLITFESKNCSQERIACIIKIPGAAKRHFR